MKPLVSHHKSPPYQFSGRVLNKGFKNGPEVAKEDFITCWNQTHFQGISKKSKIKAKFDLLRICEGIRRLSFGGFTSQS